MKRLLAVSIFILALAFPAFSGHTVAGDRYCECNNPESCVSGNSLQNKGELLNSKKSQQNAPTDVRLILLILTALMLRYKA